MFACTIHANTIVFWRFGGPRVQAGRYNDDDDRSVPVLPRLGETSFWCQAWQETILTWLTESARQKHVSRKWFLDVLGNSDNFMKPLIDFLMEIEMAKQWINSNSGVCDLNPTIARICWSAWWCLLNAAMTPPQDQDDSSLDLLACWQNRQIKVVIFHCRNQISVNLS